MSCARVVVELWCCASKPGPQLSCGRRLHPTNTLHWPGLKAAQIKRKLLRDLGIETRVLEQHFATHSPTGYYEVDETPNHFDRGRNTWHHLAHDIFSGFWYFFIWFFVFCRFVFVEWFRNVTQRSGITFLETYPKHSSKLQGSSKNGHFL